PGETSKVRPPLQSMSCGDPYGISFLPRCCTCHFDAGSLSSLEHDGRQNDHPVCAASVASRHFLDGAATPPHEEGNLANLRYHPTTNYRSQITPIYKSAQS